VEEGEQSVKIHSQQFTLLSFILYEICVPESWRFSNLQ